jgi:hypothetical protein
MQLIPESSAMRRTNNRRTAAWRSSQRLTDDPGAAIQIRRYTTNRLSAIFAKLLLSLPIAAGLLCAAPVASAQDSQSVNIPFAFSVNNHHHMELRHYQVQLVGPLPLSSQCEYSEKRYHDGSAGVGQGH